MKKVDPIHSILLKPIFSGLFFDQTFYRVAREVGISRVEAEKEWSRLIREGLIEWEKKVGGVEAFRRK